MARAKSRADGDDATGDGGRETISKREAVHRALTSLGYDARPPVIKEFIQNHFGMEIANNMISSYKSQEIHKHGGKAKKGRRGGEPAFTGIDVDDIRTVRDLAARLGVDRLRDLVDVLC